MKTAIVTGANRGLGLALVKALSKDHRVFALCRNAKNFPVAYKHENIKVLTVDITDTESVLDFVDGLKEQKIAVDLLINNAGVNDSDDDVVVSEIDEISHIFKTNVIAPTILTEYLQPLLKKATTGTVISVSSQMSRYATLNFYNAEHWPYSTSKAALNFAMAAYAVDQPLIKTLLVDPGWMKTRMGGEGAFLEPEYSAACIVKLYEKASELESGKLYSLDGELLDF
jgi:NAD(P)-dependent dehydrogenase (short-subunit alcohol dehydrogenase family)